MQIFLLIILLVVTLAMIGAILLQRSEGGGLGVGSGNMGGLMTTRGTANFLTRTTAILATAFMVICIILAIMAARFSDGGSLLSKLEQEETVVADQNTENKTNKTAETKEAHEPTAPLSSH